MGNQLTNPDEMLFRQIHPKCMIDGKPASDRFKPQPNDKGFMSVDRGAITDPASSHALYLAAGRESAAVYGVLVGELTQEAIVCREDAITADGAQPANPAHALADYTPHGEKDWKNISKRLWRKSIGRGRLHPPEVE